MRTANQKNNRKTKPDKYTHEKKQQKLRHAEIVGCFFLAQKQFTWIFGRHIWTKRVFSFWFRACFFHSSLVYCFRFVSHLMDCHSQQQKFSPSRESINKILARLKLPQSSAEHVLCTIRSCVAQCNRNICVANANYTVSAHQPVCHGICTQCVFFVYFLRWRCNFEMTESRFGKPHARQIDMPTHCSREKNKRVSRGKRVDFVDLQ